MISRDAVKDLYHLILDRDPESDLAIAEKRQANNIRDLALEMFGSEEFFNTNAANIDRILK